MKKLNLFSISSMVMVASFATSLAQAQVTCAPGAATSAKDRNLAVCGDARTLTYAKNDQKVQAVTLLFENTKQGFERRIEVKNPGLSISQLNAGQADQSPAVKKEIVKMQKEWSMKDLKPQVVSFSFDKKASLFATADLKTKVQSAQVVSKVRRSLASESPIAGGIRGNAKDAKAK